MLKLVEGPLLDWGALSVAPNVAPAPQTRAGVVYSAAAFTVWGLLPLYLRLVRAVAPGELLMHRMLWSVVFVLAVLAVQRNWGWVGRVRRSKAVLAGFAASAAALSVNWFLFIWAVNNGHNVDASLGYFINPLVSIGLGAVLLRERLTRLRRIAVGWAFLGVLWLTIVAGRVPWIGLLLAGTFGLYGLLRKTARLGALEGLALETALLSPFALGCLIWLAAHGQSRFVTGGPGLKLLVLLAGPITAVPLILFAAGARRIPLSLVGILQYIGPTLQLLVGVLVFREPFGASRAVGYALIWLAFLIASADGLLASSVTSSVKSSVPGTAAPRRSAGGARA
jgi:chloramphenicol-sensitive protein RarD